MSGPGPTVSERSLARRAVIREMWPKGFSASQIAQELGCTRNAVIGHVSRMGLQNAGIIRFTRPHTVKAKAAPKPLPPPPALEPPPYNLDLMAVSDRVCRWPYGDGPFTFCGHSVLDGSFYCPYHRSIASTPPKVKL